MSFKLNKILVPVDFSDCSKKALNFAAEFAPRFNASLILLYVVEQYFPVPEMTTVDLGLMQSRMRESGEQELARLRQSLDPNLRAETALHLGNPAVEIVKAAEELDADLIIVSTHGRTGLAHVFLGSTAEKTVRHAHCPVLVLRDREK